MIALPALLFVLSHTTLPPVTHSPQNGSGQSAQSSTSKAAQGASSGGPSLAGAAAPPPAPSANDIVATVGGKPIHASDVEPYLWNWIGSQAIREVANLRTVKEAAKAAGVTVSEAEVLSRLRDDLEKAAASKKASRSDPAPGLSAEQYLANEGFPLTRLYIRSEISLLGDKMAEKSFDPAKFVKVETAVYRAKDPSAASIGNAAERAGAAYKSLKLGIKWGQILKASGATDQIVKTDGLLGWRTVEAFPALVRESLTTLPVGGVTEPVQTQYGFQLFRVVAHGAKCTAAQAAELKKAYIPYESQKILEKLISGNDLKIELKGS